MPSTTPIRIVRIAAGIVLAAGFIGWTASSSTHFRQEAQWRDARAQGLATLAVYEGNSANPEFRLQRGRALLDNAFPPRPNEAAEEFRRGLLSDPRRSVLWTRLAEAELYAGRIDVAQAALEQAALLDPVNPRRRRQAIRLWELAGRPADARKAARELAALGPNRLAEALDEVAVLGDTPEQAFKALGLSTVPPKERPALADSIDRIYGPGAFASIVEALPAEWLSDPALRHRTIVSALVPLRYEEARQLWLRDLEETGAPFELRKGLIQPLTNDSSPWDEARPLGWQPPPKGTGVRVEWQHDPEPRAVIEMDRNLGRRFQWNILRALAPPETAVRVTAEVRVTPPANSDVILSVERGGDEKPLRIYASHEIADWQDLTITVPPQSNGAVLSISLLRDQRGYLDQGERPILEWRAVRPEAADE
ncbi:hypothetical protein KQI84_18105 [bacterium]|nr:hypothetical protein [bacterium]